MDCVSDVGSLCNTKWFLKFVGVFECFSFVRTRLFVPWRGEIKITFKGERRGIKKKWKEKVSGAGWWLGEKRSSVVIHRGCMRARTIFGEAGHTTHEPKLTRYVRESATLPAITIVCFLSPSHTRRGAARRRLYPKYFSQR